uniref:Large ribosomal subunit protein uL16c n=1 Tax=Derbesia sp. WEST4838 TaxID=1847751 RepID=A0A1C9JBE5_9CHLO|nr:ribosomal protein L16 [Derbesia sp. WEST4838]AOP19158.1 ribosomal protein L16 [Derbesia sp. WEST4838]
MLQPKRTKYRKMHRGRLKGQCKKGNNLKFGDFGLQALEPFWLTSRQIESARRVITRYTKRGGQLWIRSFPDKSVTFRAAETRMGSGKGNPELWVAVIKPGKILYELKGILPSIAKKALTNAAFKLPIKTQFISKEIV